MINPFYQAREKYRPQKIKVLFINEAPPAIERNRYFYFEHVPRGDSLFLEMMKVLFPEEVEAFDTVKNLRAEKSYFLERMQEEAETIIKTPSSVACSSIGVPKVWNAAKLAHIIGSRALIFSIPESGPHFDLALFYSNTAWVLFLS